MTPITQDRDNKLFVVMVHLTIKCSLFNLRVNIYYGNLHNRIKHIRMVNKTYFLTKFKM